MKKFIAIADKKYGQWTVIGNEVYKNNYGAISFKVKCSCGTIRLINASVLERGKTLRCKQCSDSERQANYGSGLKEKYGLWTVIDSKPQRDKWGQRLIKVECQCGYTAMQPRNKLVYGSTKGCAKCLGKRKTKAYKELSWTYFNNKIKDAEKRGYTFQITIEEAWNKFEEQNQLCALSGSSIVLYKSYSNRRSKLQTASLDRIDSTKGYIKGNVQWVHKEINKMKQSLNEQTFINWCKLVAEQN